MSYLHLRFVNGALCEHYQRGSQRFLDLGAGKGFLATLGGGLCSGDEYSQDINLSSSSLQLESQSNQKIYRGKSALKCQINLDRSAMIYCNDANIFYKNSELDSRISVFMDKESALFLQDGGFLGYSLADFKASMRTKIFIDSKLALMDNFFYQQDLHCFKDFEFFYSVVIYPRMNIAQIVSDDLWLAHSANHCSMLRILSRSEGLACEHLERIKAEFAAANNMNYQKLK